MAISRLESFLERTSINNPGNDYKAHARPGPNGEPGPLFGQQYRLGTSEAKALIAAIKKEVPAGQQKAVMQELLDRTLARDRSKGSVALTAGAAAALTYFAGEVNLVKFFGANNLPPLHPIG